MTPIGILILLMQAVEDLLGLSATPSIPAGRIMATVEEDGMVLQVGQRCSVGGTLFRVSSLEVGRYGVHLTVRDLTDGAEMPSGPVDVAPEDRSPIPPTLAIVDANGHSFVVVIGGHFYDRALQEYTLVAVVVTDNGDCWFVGSQGRGGELRSIPVTDVTPVLPSNRIEVAVGSVCCHNGKLVVVTSSKARNGAYSLVVSPFRPWDVIELEEFSSSEDVTVDRPLKGTGYRYGARRPEPDHIVDRNRSGSRDPSDSSDPSDSIGSRRAQRGVQRLLRGQRQGGVRRPLNFEAKQGDEESTASSEQRIRERKRRRMIRVPSPEPSVEYSSSSSSSSSSSTSSSSSLLQQPRVVVAPRSAPRASTNGDRELALLVQQKWNSLPRQSTARPVRYMDRRSSISTDEDDVNSADGQASSDTLYVELPKKRVRVA